MKRNFAIFWGALLFVLVACRQQGEQQKPPYFTGEIDYEYTYLSDVIDADSLQALKPDRSTFRFDLTNYQSQFIGKDTFTYYYFSELNKCLSNRNNNIRFNCEDYSLPTDSVLNFKIYDADTLVFGQECLVLEFQSVRFWTRYYVSKELKIAPPTYQLHNAYNWRFYGEKTDGGLILQLEHQYPDYTMKGVVKRIRHFEQNEEAVELQLNKEMILGICEY